MSGINCSAVFIMFYLKRNMSPELHLNIRSNLKWYIPWNTFSLKCCILQGVFYINMMHDSFFLIRPDILITWYSNFKCIKSYFNAVVLISHWAIQMFVSQEIKTIKFNSYLFSVARSFYPTWSVPWLPMAMHRMGPAHSRESYCLPSWGIFRL